MIIFLDNVRSIFNVGAIFRTSDAVGVENLILAGYTPHPPEKKLIKTSLGAIDYINYEHVLEEKKLQCLIDYKNRQYKIISVEQTPDSICYTEASTQNLLSWDKTIYIFGNEIVGVSKEILDISHTIVDIPMNGKKNSLNISVTVGIISYESRKYKSNTTRKES